MLARVWSHRNGHRMHIFPVGMVVSGVDVDALLDSYDHDQLTIGVVASHTSLQLLHGARVEGFRTLGIAVGEERRRMYRAFPMAEPDEWMILDDYKELNDRVEELQRRNTIIIPHGSLVEYLGAEHFASLEVPTYGNRHILRWESSRDLQRQWLEAGGCRMPKLVKDPRDIDGPVIVKYAGARGGRGYFIARDYRDFRRNVNLDDEFTIQEYVLGTRYYLHFFFDPISSSGLQVIGRGNRAGEELGELQLLSIDRRDEANVDEFYKLGSLRDLREMHIEPSFVVTGNIPVVLRESLLPEAFRLAEGAVRSSFDLEEGARGMIGPFCLETIVNDQLEFRVFEISARIVAGSNPYIAGSPYSEMIQPSLSTGRRIAQSIRTALEQGQLTGVVS